MMLPKWLLSLAALGLAEAAAASCSSSQSLSLCCTTLQPFSDNAYVWNNECGFYSSDESILVASGCEVLPSSECTYENYYAACCEEYMPGCPSNAGAVGYNCTGYEVD